MFFGKEVTRRLQRLEDQLDGLVRRQAEIDAMVARVDIEWEDTKNTVRRSYQRLEQAAVRARHRETPCEGNGEEEEALTPEQIVSNYKRALGGAHGIP